MQNVPLQSKISIQSKQVSQRSLAFVLSLLAHALVWCAFHRTPSGEFKKTLTFHEGSQEKWKEIQTLKVHILNAPVKSIKNTIQQQHAWIGNHSVPRETPKTNIASPLGDAIIFGGPLVAQNASPLATDVPARSGHSSEFERLLPSSDSHYIDSQRKNGSQETLEMELRVEIRYIPRLRETRFTILTAGSPDNAYLYRVMRHFEKNIVIPSQAYEESLHDSLRYEMIWPSRLHATPRPPSDEETVSSETPKLNRKKGTSLESVNENFDDVLLNSFISFPLPERRTGTLQRARIAFFLSLSREPPLQSPDCFCLKKRF